MKGWQWHEVHASTAVAENTAVKILTWLNAHEPLRRLRAVRGKRIPPGFRRFDLKFEFLPHEKALVRVDLSQLGFNWYPIRAFCLWPAETKRHLLFLFDFSGGELRYLRDLEREISYGPVKENLLSDPLPRGFSL